MEIDLTEVRRALDDIWNAALDASTSADFRDAQGHLDEAAYLRYKTNIIDRALNLITKS